MKNRITLIIYFLTIWSGLQLSAQDYKINFAVLGNDNVYLDSIKVENTVQNTAITINGDDILNLVSHISSITNPTFNPTQISVYPNPTTESAILKFKNPKNEDVKVDIFDIQGKLISSSSSFVPAGEVSYSLSKISNGIYIVHVSSKSINSSIKLISSSSHYKNSIIEINKTALIENPKYPSKPKSSPAGETILMQYNDFENLKFTANLNEQQSIIDNFVASQNETVEFSFNNLVTFIVSDGVVPVQGATISINGQILTSDAGGIATVFLANGTYPYTVIASGHDNITGVSVTVNNANVEEPVVLSLGINDIQSAIDISLFHMMNEEIWGRKLSVALMLRSDMVNLQSAQTRRIEMNDHTISTNNEMVYDNWKRSYMGIKQANIAIARAEYVDVAEEVKNPITAQAYFARAWYYFHLVRLHGDIPYVTEPNVDPMLMNTPAAEVYQNILADLDYAKTWLPNTVPSRAIPSKAAASSYIALVYLTLGEWQKAFDEAKEVIDNAAAYDLALDPDFQALFDANRIDMSLEPVFSLDYRNFEAPDNGYDMIAPMTGIRGDDDDEGWSVAVPTMAVYESFDKLDYRTRVSFQTEVTIDGTTVDYTQFDISGHEHATNSPYIAKYTRYPGPYARSAKRATSHNYSMLRYAELLLIAAEAAVELEDNTSALMYVNMVRARARQGGNTTNGGYVPETVAASTVPADLTGTITITDIIEERRIELAFEGKRWYDIKRRLLGDDVFSATGYEGFKPEFDASVDYLTPIPELK